MNTMQAEYAGALDRFRAEIVERDRSNMRWQIGLWGSAIAVTIAAVGIGVAFLSLQDRQPVLLSPPAAPPVIIQTALMPAEVHADPEALPDAAAAEP